ncbi:chymotrypsin-C-like [Clytia hemisphaerica]|uniref:Uncharacterized protein n=1 Tax=Clytia hemisphaerica TaxID=252671 RepID=A0A7M5XHK6_9CNID
MGWLHLVTLLVLGFACIQCQETCEDKDDQCRRWYSSCSTNKYVKINCKKTCGTCPKNKDAAEETDSECKDTYAKCYIWQNQNCKKRPLHIYLRTHCKKSCGLCKSPSSFSSCIDSNKNCGRWAKVGYCERNKGFMYTYCKKSCRQCKADENVKPTVSLRTTSSEKEQQKQGPKRPTTTTITTTTITTVPPYASRNDATCGYNTLSKQISAFIVGGEISSRGKWPWLAAIYLYGEHHCGATLIHPQYLMTAAHCVFDGGFYKEKEDMHIVLNDFKRNIDEGGEQVIQVEKYWVHPQYAKAYTIQFEHDIAVIKLKEPAKLSNTSVNTACLPQRNEKIPLNSKCFITGWGKTDGSYLGEKSEVLMEGQLPLMTNKKCAVKNRFKGKPLINHNMMCGGSEGNILSTCQGDSGGPYVCMNASKRFVLQGVVSFGHDECKTSKLFPTFTRVSQYVDWIYKTMDEKGDDENDLGNVN